MRTLRQPLRPALVRRLMVALAAVFLLVQYAAAHHVHGRGSEHHGHAQVACDFCVAADRIAPPVSDATPGAASVGRDVRPATSAGVPPATRAPSSYSSRAPPGLGA